MSELNPDTQPVKRKKGQAGFWISLVIIVVVIALGVLGGYQSGKMIRLNAQSTQVSQALGEQFALAGQDFAAGRYDVARQRLEYIIKNEPSYPGATDMLTKVILQLSITPTATLTPTPTITPTPDLRAQEAIFNQAQQQLAGGDWSGAIITLDSLRKRDSLYRTAQVDAMYYAALRNRGVDAIMGQRAYAQTTNLEGGIYDLTLAERFGPLDGTADGLRSFARLYIQGASYWELDWPKAIEFFSQVYQYTPNLRDSSNFTAAERYRIALLKYADILFASPGKDHCNSLDYYFKSFAISQDPAYTKKVADLNLECNPPTATPQPSTPTPTTEVVVPTVEIVPTTEVPPTVEATPTTGG